jgi:hypothetical protein
MRGSYKNSPLIESFFKKRDLLLQRQPFARNPALVMLPDPAVILLEVPVHRVVKRGEPDFPLLYKKIKSFPVPDSADRGKLITES